MTFDPAKPVQRRDGKPARVICTDARGTEPIVALHQQEDGREAAYRHYASGEWVPDTVGPADLVNIPETVTTYQNVYATGYVSPYYYRREDVEHCALERRIAVLILRTTGDVTTAELEPVESAR